MRYSPYPAEKYALSHDAGHLNPLGESAEDEAIWNLAWLSIPHIDSYLNLAYQDFEAFKSLNGDFPFMVTTLIVEDFRRRPELRQILTTLSPAEFLKVLTPKFYTSMHSYKRGGDDWLTTVRCRAEAAQARIDIVQLAAKAENVMVVDFKLNNGSQQRIESEPKILANSHPVDAKPTAESPISESEGKGENKRFIDHSDGTVTDIHTGRMWKRCALGQRWNGSTCHGESTPLTWETATALSPSFAGYKDWRLPTVDEFEEVFGNNSDRSENKTAFPWLIYEIAKEDHATAFWSSTTWRNDSGFAVNAYDPERNDIIYCETEYLDNPLQVLLVRSIEGAAHAVSDAHISPSTTPEESMPDHPVDLAELMDMAAMDETRALVYPRPIRHEDCMYTVEQFAQELKLPQHLLLEQLRVAGVSKSDVVDTVSEADKAHLLDYLRKKHGSRPEDGSTKITLTHKQTDEIRNKSDVMDETDASVLLLLDLVEQINRLEARFETMMERIESIAHTLHSRPTESVDDVVPQTGTDRMDAVTYSIETSYREFLYRLAEQPYIVLSDLRTSLLPMNLLPNAVIDDINEQALDLTGEMALIESGDSVEVQQSVLKQVIAALLANQF